MVLADRDIHKRTSENCLIENHDPACFTNIGYDLRADYFVSKGINVPHVTLKCGESAFVGTTENIKLPNDMIARIVLKNSRIRQGFSLDAPVYQPGHYTKVFFRLTNVSSDEIELRSGDKYAMIMFETLSRPVDSPYSGTFSGEMDFSGMGRYTDIYKKEMQQIERKAEDLKTMERSIYANVLVILTVFVALFSFLTTNLSLLSASANITQFLVYNFVMLGCVSFLVALLNGIISVKKRSIFLWGVSAIMFVAAILVFIFL